MSAYPPPGVAPGSADAGDVVAPQTTAVGAASPLATVAAPEAITYTQGQAVDVAWAQRLAATLEQATRVGLAATAEALPSKSLVALLAHAGKALQAVPVLVEVAPAEDATVTVVGDTHGQFHDVLHMLDIAGPPSPQSIYIFNGDYVDRGAWGVELLATLAAYSLALPGRFILLRGNHESLTCSRAYGFHGELKGKYGKAAKAIFRACGMLFASLPLAALVAGKALVMHGGLFRKPVVPTKARGKKRGRSRLQEAPLVIGDLEDLRRAHKGGQDPHGLGQTQVAGDVLWSDPMPTEGLQINHERGIGLMFGPDQTQAFMEANGLSLVLRSHEGPDARSREDCPMPPMCAGYSVDHKVPAGCLMTVFSAPDYPQFQPVDDPSDRFNNLAAVAVLQAPDWATPVMKQYSAVLPRPEAAPFYDLCLPDSDDEGPEGLRAAGYETEASGMSGDDGSVVSASGLEDCDTPSARDEEDSPASKAPRIGFPAEADKLTVTWGQPALGACADGELHACGGATASDAARPGMPPVAQGVTG